MDEPGGQRPVANGGTHALEGLGADIAGGKHSWAARLHGERVAAQYRPRLFCPHVRPERTARQDVTGLVETYGPGQPGGVRRGADQHEQGGGREQPAGAGTYTDEARPAGPAPTTTRSYTSVGTVAVTRPTARASSTVVLDEPAPTGKKGGHDGVPDLGLGADKGRDRGGRHHQDRPRSAYDRRRVDAFTREHAELGHELTRSPGGKFPLDTAGSRRSPPSRSG